MAPEEPGEAAAKEGVAIGNEQTGREESQKEKGGVLVVVGVWREGGRVEGGATVV